MVLPDIGVDTSFELNEILTLDREFCNSDSEDADITSFNKELAQACTAYFQSKYQSMHASPALGSFAYMLIYAMKASKRFIFVLIILDKQGCIFLRSRRSR